MADLSWAAALTKTSGSGGGTGTTDYNELSNLPVNNIDGDATLVELESGVYNIKGKWKVTADDDDRESGDDDLFYVLNDGENCKMTWVSASGVKSATVPISGTAADIEFSEIPSVGDLVNQLTGTF